ncbi:hypothetical protein [Serinicoccus marinus]|uniref:hypothetical protein n=1 Tax=Serinicoccus marinus TaxID=247333 RepID=UPI00248F9073|nr:hypothetical protein [Serinicoccus marinus]
MMRFEDLPEADTGRLRDRLRERPSRRGFIARVLGAGTAVGVGSLALVNRGGTRVKAQAAYFLDYTDTSTGPCATYARDHTENGIQCGPSPMCTSQACCWRYRSGAGNVVAWHKNGPGIDRYYVHRPDDCWGGVYDSWNWKFSDGRTWRCSDGWTCSGSGSCMATICPWAI